MKKFQYLAAACALLCGSTTVYGAGDAKKGQEVFDQCAVCHNADSTEKKMGPGLKGLFKNKALGNGKPVNDANVTNKINEGGTEPE